MALTASTPATALPPTAGVGRRAAAALIDLAVIVGGEIGAVLVGGILIQATGVSSANLSAGHIGVAAALARAVTQSALYLGPIAYLYVGWRRGATVGMRARECALRSADRVTAPTSSQLVLRLCGLFYSVLFAGAGLAWGLVRSDRRGWPDLYAGTVVVHTPRWPTLAAPTLAAPGWSGSPWNAA
ncbi:MAG TPA: RDD family protein, partial [Candidatus Dormibacteraeota bacterium]|nr:RDD family protein [Candidatus Dormibacteraeota bacterium]